MWSLAGAEGTTGWGEGCNEWSAGSPPVAAGRIEKKDKRRGRIVVLNARGRVEKGQKGRLEDFQKETSALPVTLAETRVA